MRTLTPFFYHGIVVILEFSTLVTMKIKDLIVSLKAHDTRILQSQTFNKHGNSRNIWTQHPRRPNLMLNLNPSRNKEGHKTSINKESKQGQKSHLMF